MNNLSIGTVLLVLTSCNNSHNTKDKSNHDSLNVFVDSVRADSRKINTQSEVSKNYSQWRVFWKVFKSSTRDKDTLNIVALVNFPFLQNGDTITYAEFKDLFISQLDGHGEGYRAG